MKCKSCGSIENLMKAGSKKKADGSRVQRYKCRKCNARQQKKYRERHPNDSNRIIENYRKRYPERHRARLIARKAIPLKPCQVCGADAVRHHPDWSKPLEVVFLCILHHKQVHLGVIPCPK